MYSVGQVWEWCGRALYVVFELKDAHARMLSLNDGRMIWFAYIGTDSTRWKRLV